jgi:hypothetical protein
MVSSKETTFTSKINSGLNKILKNLVKEKTRQNIDHLPNQTKEDGRE